MNDVVEFAATARRLRSQLLILFVSTTGDGEQTDSMQHIWNQLYVLRARATSSLFPVMSRVDHDVDLIVSFTL